MRRYLSVAGGISGRLLRKLVANPALFLPPMLMPIFFFVAFAGGLSAIDQAPGFDYPAGYTTFEFGFVLLQAAAFGGVFTGFSIAADFESGFGRRLMLATPNRTAMIAGYAGLAVTRAVVTFAAVTVVGLLAGMDIIGGPGELFAFYFLALIVNVAGLLFAAGIALRFRSLQATPLMQVPVFLFLFLAPVYVPRELLGGWVHSVSAYDPATHIMEAGRDLMAGQPADLLGAFAIAVGMVALLAIFAVRGLRSAEAAG
jgi:ABC-2 type transport system permease protein